MTSSNNVRLFLCLCKDLGYSLVRGIVPSQKQLGDLRKKLLELSESDCSPSAISAFELEFSRHFSADSPRLSLLHPITFRDVYQLLSYNLKIRVESTHEQEREYIRSLKETEEETRAWRWDSNSAVSRLARVVSLRAGQSLDLSHDNIENFARHGPGAVLDGSRYDDKSHWNCRFRSLDRILPHDWFFANPSLLLDIASVDRQIGVYSDTVADYIECKLNLVPKDWKGPRGVFISPKEAVFCQLGVDGAIKESIQRSFLRHCHDPISQLPSQEVAFSGSYARWWSTLDLKDASDRIPLSLVRRLFHTSNYRSIACTRPSHALLPNGERIRLSMSSPMGDGKTFGVLTWVCAVITIASMMHHDGYLPTDRITASVLEDYAKKCRVFGDDIAVRTEYFDAVVSGLEIHNLRVNKAKSFSRGFFRESCGMDAYHGVCVTPLRQKINLDAYNPRTEFDRLIAFHNRVRSSYSHLENVSRYLESFIRSRHRHVGFTTNSEAQPLLLLVSTEEECVKRNSLNGIRFNTDLFRWETKCVTRKRELTFLSSLDDRYRLNHYLFGRRETPPRPYSVLWEGSGSPRLHAEVNRSLFELGMRNVPVPRKGFQRGWTEMI